MRACSRSPETEDRRGILGRCQGRQDLQLDASWQRQAAGGRQGAPRAAHHGWHQRAADARGGHERTGVEFEQARECG